MATAGSIVVSLLAKTGSFETDMDRAARKVDQTARTLDRYVRAIGAAGVAAATAAAAITVQSAKAMDASAKMAQQIGVTTEALTAMRFSAQQFADVSDTTFDMSMRRMTRRIAEAAEGSGAAKSALEGLGLSAQQLARMSPDRQMLALADAMQSTERQADRLRYAMAIFDTEGMALLPALQQGSAALEEGAKQAQRFGVVLSTEAAQAAEELTENLGKLNSAQQGLRQQLAEALLPTMVSMTDSLVEFSSNVGDSGEKIETALRIAAMAGTATATVFASRLVGAAYTSAAGWVVATKDAMVHQAQLARLSAQAAGTSASMTALGAAAAGSMAAVRRAGTLALGVMGGPAGLIITAGLVGASFLAMGRNAEAAAVDVGELTKSLDTMSQRALESAQYELENEVQRLETEAETTARALRTMQSDLAALTEVAARGNEYVAERLRDVQHEVRLLEGEHESLNEDLQTASDRLGQVNARLQALGDGAQGAAAGVSTLDDALNETSASAEKYLERLESRALLAGITTVRGELEALVNAGKEQFSDEDLKRARELADIIDRTSSRSSAARTDPTESFRARLAEAQQLTVALQEYGLAVDDMLPAERELLNLQGQMSLAVADRTGKTSDATLRSQIALTQETAAHEALAKQLRMTLEMRRDYTDAIGEQNAEIYGSIADLEDQVATWALTDAETARNVDALAQSRTRERIATEEAILARQLLNGASEEEIAHTQQAIAGLRTQLEYRVREAELNEKIRQQMEDRAAFERTVSQWTDTVRSIDDVFRRGFADMLNEGRGSWDAFTDSMATTFKTTVADTLYKAFAQPFVVRIVAQMAGIMGGPGVGQQVLQQSGLGGGMPSMGWLTDFGGSITDTLNNFAWKNIGSEGFLGDISRTLFDSSEAIGHFAEIGGDILGYGKAIFAAIDGEWGKAAGTAIGQFAGGPIGAMIGSFIGGFIDDAFSGETRYGAGYGIGHEGVAFHSGGPSGGDPNAPAVMQSIEQTWNAIHELAGSLGGSLAGYTMGAGWELSPEKGNSFVWTDVVGPGEFVSHTEGIGRRDLSGVKDGDVVLQEFQTELQRTIIRGLQLADVDEHWREWIDQFDASELDGAGVQSVVAMIDALSQLRTLATDMGMANLAAATAQAHANIIELSGGVESFSSNLQAYQQAFYSDSERQAAAISMVSQSLSDLGLEMPELTGTADDMRASYRSLVDAQDLTTESGQRTYAALIGLAGAFDGVATSAAAAAAAQQQAIQAEYDAIEQLEYEAARAAWESANDRYQTALDDAGTAMQIVRNAIDLQKNELREAFEAQSAIIQTTIDAAQDAVGRLEAMAGRLGSTLDSMFSSMDPLMTQQRAMLDIAAAARRARATGELPELASLETALQRVSNPSMDAYGSLVDFQRDFYGAAADIGFLQELAGDQLTIEQRALTAAQDQLSVLKTQYEAEIEYYDSMLDLAQAQYDEAVGNRLAVMSVSEAMANLSSSISALANTPRPGNAPTPPAPTQETPEDIVAGWYSDVLGFEDAAGAAYWVEQLRNQGRGAAFDDFVWSAQNNGSLPSFDVGTNYVPHDMTANIHRGERIIPAAENQELMARLNQPASDARATQAELQLLRNDMREMHADTRRMLYQITKNTGKTAKYTEPLDIWAQTGVPTVEHTV